MEVLAAIDAITPGLLELQHRYSFVGRRSAGQVQRCDFLCPRLLLLSPACETVRRRRGLARGRPGVAPGPIDRPREEKKVMCASGR